MRSSIVRSTAIALTLAALTACQRKDAIDKVVEAQHPETGAAANGDPVRLEVRADKTSVGLGDDIVFHFKVTNSGGSRVQVNVPRIDKRSVTIRVRREGGGIATITRNHADLSPAGEFVYDAPEARELGPGESLEQDISTVALETGKIAFTPSYVRQGAPAPLAAPTIEVTVTPADARNTHLGVKLETSKGSYTARLRPDVAYNTVESFTSLVRKGFYDGLKFHRIIRGFMAQGGDPKGTGEGGPKYFLPLEVQNPPKLRHARGVISMARTQIDDTAGSQFFLMFATRPDLDAGRYTTFGEMVEGDATLKALENVRVRPGGEGSSPAEDVVIQRAELLTLP